MNTLNLSGFINREELEKASFYRTPKGTIKLSKDQLQRIESLTEEDLTKIYKKSTGVNDKTIQSWKNNLSKKEKIDVIVNIVQNKEYGAKILNDIFNPREGEIRKYKDGEYKFTEGHWKKLK